MSIVKALEHLSLEGVNTPHDHVIETVLSKLFMRGDRVYKAYKHRTADFSDLADPEVRRGYISEDFFWNNTMAPEIYLELRHVRRDGETWKHVDIHEGEDHYIVMKKIDVSRDLMRLLRERSHEREHFADYVVKLEERLDRLTRERKSELTVFFDRGASHIRDEVLGTLGWAKADGMPELLHDEVDRAESLFLRAFESDPYWGEGHVTPSVVIDVNGENILFLDEGVSFIDVMPPKDAWRVHDRYFLICRTSADVAALAGDADADTLHESYGAIRELPSVIVRKTYEIAAALIQVPYRKMVGQPELARRYALFIRRACDELEAELGQA